jgi:hypothetical protein
MGYRDPVWFDDRLRWWGRVFFAVFFLTLGFFLRVLVQLVMVGVGR